MQWTLAGCSAERFRKALACGVLRTVNCGRRIFIGIPQKLFRAHDLSLPLTLSRKSPVAAVAVAELVVERVVAQAAALEVGPVGAAAAPGEPVELGAREELAARVVQVELAERAAGRVEEMAARRVAAAVHPLARR
jgi:hypothetical protein